MQRKAGATTLSEVLQQKRRRFQSDVERCIIKLNDDVSRCTEQCRIADDNFAQLEGRSKLRLSRNDKLRSLRALRAILISIYARFAHE